MLHSNALRRVLFPVLTAFTLVAQAPPPQAPPSSIKPASFSPGRETLNYEIEWRLVTAGHARLEWYSSPIIKDGWESKMHLESIGLVSRLFHVNDDYTSQMTNNLCATSTYMTAREGNRSRDTKVTFDGSARKADYFEKDLKTNAVVKNEIDVPPCVRDIIGGLYTLRTMNLEPGKTGQIPVSNGKKAVYMKVESQRREEIRVPAGTLKTIRYEVFAFDNQLYTRPGHLHIWLTDDSRKLPVQIEIKLQFVIGTITLRLDKETRS